MKNFVTRLYRFWIAFRLTWQGKSVSRSHVGLHWDWLEDSNHQLHLIVNLVKRNPPDASFLLRYEGKEMTVMTALKWLDYCIKRELPSLLRSGNPHSLTAFQALVWNLKDLLITWQDKLASDQEEMDAALSSVIQHFNSLPQKGDD